MPQYRGNARAKKCEWLSTEVGRRVWGTFGIALENEMKKIPKKKKCLLSFS
jgi:UDP-N-acetylenolpyruvoylglucosamine reductase